MVHLDLHQVDVDYMSLTRHNVEKNTMSVRNFCLHNNNGPDILMHAVHPYILLVLSQHFLTGSLIMSHCFDFGVAGKRYKSKSYKSNLSIYYSVIYTSIAFTSNFK